jgi:hypothetical protein
MKFILAISMLATMVASGGFALSQDTNPAQQSMAKTTPADGFAILDGMTFSGKAGPLGKALDIDDKWVFSKGSFVSTQCSTICKYPKAPYFVRQKNGKTQFISEGHCTDKDAKILWRGTVDKNTVKGVFTWTVSRWYWTVEKKFRFEGTLIPSSKPIASN